MENRGFVVAEYLRLRVLLNAGNLVSNQKTDIEFSLKKVGPSSFTFMASLKGPSMLPKIQICVKSGVSGWEPSGYSGLGYLEDFCATFIRKRWSNKISGREIESLVAELHEDLRSLGISSK